MDFDTQILPILKSWVDVLIQDKFDRVDPATFWRDMRAVLLHYPPVTTKRILFTYPHLVVIIMNHLTLEVLEQDRVVWNNACECTEKFVRDCGENVWSCSPYSLTELLDTLFEVIGVIMGNLTSNFDDFIRAHALLVEMMYSFEDWPKEYQLQFQANMEAVIQASHRFEKTPHGKKLNKIMESISSALENKVKTYLFGLLPVHLSSRRGDLLATVTQFFDTLLKCHNIINRPTLLLILLAHISEMHLIPEAVLTVAAHTSCMDQAMVGAMLGRFRTFLLSTSGLLRALAAPSLLSDDEAQRQMLLDVLPSFLLSSHKPCQQAAMDLLTTIDKPLPAAPATSLIAAPPRDVRSFLAEASWSLLRAVLVATLRAYGSLSRGGMMDYLPDSEVGNLFSAVDELSDHCVSVAQALVRRDKGKDDMGSGKDAVMVEELLRDCAHAKSLVAEMLRRRLQRGRKGRTPTDSLNRGVTIRRTKPPESPPPSNAECRQVIDLCRDSPPPPVPIRAQDTLEGTAPPPVPAVSADQHPPRKGQSDDKTAVGEGHNLSTVFADPDLPATFTDRISTAHAGRDAGSAEGDTGGPLNLQTVQSRSRLSVPVRKNPFAIACGEWRPENESRLVTRESGGHRTVSMDPPIQSWPSTKTHTHVTSIGQCGSESSAPSGGVATGHTDSFHWLKKNLQSRVTPSPDCTAVSASGSSAKRHVDQTDRLSKGTDAVEGEAGSSKWIISKRARDTAPTATAHGQAGDQGRGAKPTSAMGSVRPTDRRTSRFVHAITREAAIRGLEDMSRVDSYYNLDVFGECDTSIDLDKGYENFLPKVTKPEDLMKPKSKGIDLNALLVGGASPSSKKTPSSTSTGNTSRPSDKGSSLDTLERAPSPSSPSIAQDMASISIDSFLVKLLSLPLASFRRGVDNDSSGQGGGNEAQRKIAAEGQEQSSAPLPLKQVPVRFQDESEYVRVFQPLLEAEMEASLKEFVESEGQGATSRRDRKDGGRLWGVSTHSEHPAPKKVTLPRIYIRCAMLIDRSDIHESEASSALVEARVATVQNKGEGGNMEWGASLQKDDLVVIFRPEDDKGEHLVRA